MRSAQPLEKTILELYPWTKMQVFYLNYTLGLRIWGQWKEDTD